MKHITVILIMIFTLNAADRSACSQEQIAKMILNNLSEATIDKVCAPKVTKVSSKKNNCYGNYK